MCLVAHNAKAFDIQHLFRTILQHDLKPDFSMIVGFADSLNFFRKSYPELKGSYSLLKLHNFFIGTSFAAHDALDDAQALLGLMRHCNIKITEMDVLPCSWVENNLVYQRGVKERLDSLSPLLQGRVLSKGMTSKIARSGLNLKHLKAAYYRGGDEGIRKVLTEKFNRKCRVTSKKM